MSTAHPTYPIVVKAGVAIATVSALVLLAQVRLSPHGLTLITDGMIFGIFALALNVLLGWTGLVSLGHALFFALGAYGMAIFNTMIGLPPSIAMAASLGVASIAAILIGAIAVRTSGMYFLLLMLAFGEMLYAAAVKLKVFGGDDGLIGVSRPDLSWLSLDTGNPTGFFIFVGFALAVVLSLLYGLSVSPLGTILRGIRENERRMIALGYNVWGYKLIAFFLSGTISALAGALSSQHLQLVNPEFANWLVSGEGLLMVIIGGSQVLLGPVIGSLLFVVLKDVLSSAFREHILLFGLFFVATVVFFRGGIGGTLVRLWTKPA